MPDERLLPRIPGEFIADALLTLPPADKAADGALADCYVNVPRSDARFFMARSANVQGSRMRPLIVTLISAILLAGCAIPMQYHHAQMIPYDEDTQYSVAPRSDGFTITIDYFRYQFMVEVAGVTVACKNALIDIAYEYAEKQGRKIAPINEQGIRMSMARNEFTGITTCSGIATADWQR